MRDQDYEDVPKTLTLAAGLWTLGVMAGAHAEVFVRMSPEAFMGLAVLATSLAASVVMVDRRIGSWLEQHGRFNALLALLGLGVIAAAVGMGLAGPEDVRQGALPWAPVWLLALPMTAAASLAAFRAARREGAGAHLAQAAPPLLFSRR